MALGEDRKIILRGVSRRAVETFLLIVGLSLGIGASAAGIALVSRTIESSQQLLALPEYREIIVSTRSDAEEMDVPIVAVGDTEDTVLTSMNLVAAEDAQDVEYAYVKQSRVFRNVVSMVNREQATAGGAGRSAGGGDVFVFAPDGAPPPDGPAGRLPDIREDENPPPEAERAAADASASIEDDGSGDEASESAPSDARPQRELAEEFRGRLQTALDGPTPVLEEWYGYSVSPDFFAAWGLRAAHGDLFTTEDIASGSVNAMVLGSTLASSLFEDGEALGRRLLDFRDLVTITGILEPTGTTVDDLAFVPAFMPDVVGDLTTGEFAGIRGVWGTELSFMVADPDRLDEAAAQLGSYFDREFGPDAVVLSVPREEAEAVRNRNRRLSAIILFLGLSGLFIAGVNVSNILLSRALRRQKTVGILKALGASRNGIFRLFFAEALSIGTSGTAVGVVVALALSSLMERTIDIGKVNPVMLALGLGLSWLLTALLTVFPALQASRIPAAEAMRTE